MTFAQQLKAARKKAGLTQAELAALIKASKSAIEKWEAGREPMETTKDSVLDRLERVAEAQKHVW